MNPFGGMSGTTTIDAANPLLTWINPVLQIIGIVVLVFLVWRVVSNYMKGAHSKIAVEIVFGILAAIITFKPSVIGPIVGWLITKLGG